jgi:LacI family transcriptional regulator
MFDSLLPLLPNVSRVACVKRASEEAARVDDTHDRSARRIGIRDVAERAGVAPSTASRALSLPDRVSRATQVRVRDAARELGYEGDARNRVQVSRRHLTVAVIVPDITNPFYFGAIRGAQRRLASAGWSQLLVDTEESVDAERTALSAIVGKADGAVLMAPRLSDEQIARAAEVVPLVVLNRRPPGVPAVLIDSPTTFGQAVEHLASLGHRRLAYLAGPDESGTNRLRWAAVQAAGRRLSLDVTRLGPFAPMIESGSAAGDAVVNAGATACIAFNDLLAIGVLQRLKERGVTVPDDVSVVGCDDIFGADFCDPPLTTMTAPIERAGRAAVSMLLQLLDRRQQDASAADSLIDETLELPAHLMIRRSSGPAPR